MYFVYVLLSDKDRQFYTGFTTNLKQRIEDHKKGRVESTKNRRPLMLIYFEAYIEKTDASKREVFLKSGSGKRYINKQLNCFLTKYNRGVEQPGSSSGS